jgi:hypothetical protein
MSLHPLLHAEVPFTGYWKIVDSRDGFVQTILAVYEYGDTVFGRNIVNYDEDSGELIDTIYDPALRVARVKGEPYLTQVNLFWGLRKTDEKWQQGTILDPRSGRTYACELWPEDGTLVIRGRWGPFHRNVVLYRASKDDFPDKFVPPDTRSWGPMLPPVP